MYCDNCDRFIDLDADQEHMEICKEQEEKEAK